MLESRIQQIPNILKLDRLVVAGNVTIGINVTLKVHNKQHVYS